MDKFLGEIIERYKNGQYARQYKEEYTGGYSFKHMRSRLIALREIAIIRDFLALRMKHIQDKIFILDVPCGSGKLGKMLSAFPVWITGGDISRQMMALAAGEYEPAKFMGLLEFDAQRMPLASGCMDMVVCLRLFQRLPRSHRINILKEIKRVAGKGVIISYSYDSWYQRLRGRLRNLYDSEKPTLSHATLDAIKQELKEAGFRAEKIRFVLPGLSSEVIIHAEPQAD